MVLQGRPRRRDRALSKAKTVEYERRLISENEQSWCAKRGVFFVKISHFEARKSKPFRISFWIGYYFEPQATKTEHPQWRKSDLLVVKCSRKKGDSFLYHHFIQFRITVWEDKPRVRP